MRVESYSPSNLLKPFIKSFTFIESEDGTVNKILPDTSIVMAFRYRGATFARGDGVRLPAAAITGLTRSVRVIGYAGESATLLVHFSEAGGAAFSDAPLHELFEQHVPLDNFVHRQKLQDVEDQLAEAKNNLQRRSLIEQFLFSQLKEDCLDELILDAVQRIKSANGNLRIRDLTASLAISQDPFEKRFRQAIGTSPKQFARIVRLRNVIGNYSQTGNFTEAALAAGYFDQAHFTKDFKSFTGQTPAAFLGSPSSW